MKIGSLPCGWTTTTNLIFEELKLCRKSNANGWRADILRFNMELVEHTRHTREDYIEILDVIDKYEKYCDSHKDYENNRAVHAIANVERCYDDRLKNNDFA